MDLIIDCSDNFETKILLNRVCFYNKRPLISAGVYVWEGWVTTFPFYREDIDQYPCLECLFGEIKKEEKKNGKIIEDIFYSAPAIITTVGIVASYQVNEAVKMLIGEGELLIKKVLFIDGKTNKSFIFEYEKNPACEFCSKAIKNS